jgi:hypothetical protein
MLDAAPRLISIVDERRQAELLNAATLAVHYLDLWLKSPLDTIPNDRRGDLANIATRLEAAREAVMETQTVEAR